ncbi:AGC family protein kinase [Tritrichomonas foetus]|uniref:non-specific serine/threonine protein kinase n=1 Tax=Tritrichomonas foetus TaxID=1144522 RepID=A0A1J4KQ40_9EUKA|nr:AGC family protein kinase [Tritrichomonas foetus]|eukprot:OHT11908.1 AGC family protein kinase [Tritrichomonas foetus]
MSIVKSRSIPKRLSHCPRTPSKRRLTKSLFNSNDASGFADYRNNLFSRNLTRCKQIKSAYEYLKGNSSIEFEEINPYSQFIEKLAFSHKSSEFIGDIGNNEANKSIDANKREAALALSIAFVIIEMEENKHFNHRLIEDMANLPSLSEGHSNNSILFCDNDYQKENQHGCNCHGKNRLVKCRICEKDVPVEFLEFHTQFCLECHISFHKFSQNTEKIKPLISSLETIDLIIKKKVNSLLTVKMPYSKLAVDLINDTLSYLHEIKYVSKSLTANTISLLTKRKYLIKKIRITHAIEEGTTGILPNIESILSLPEASRSLDSFKVISPIAKGGYGRVSLCEKTNTGDLFAIKMIPKDDLDKRNGYNQALIEKDSMMKGMSAHVVKLYYTFQAENFLYLVMEFMPGGDLYSLLSNVGSLDEETLKYYAVEIASALGHLHSCDIVHCDLKPDNLLISEDGHIKLGDFGLSKIAFEGGYKSSCNEKAEGTPEYLAPEVLTRGEVGPAADWWSFGAILFEMAEGIPPFTGDTAEEVFAKVVKGNYEWTSDISESLKDLVKGLLTIDPDDRMGFDEVMYHPFFDDVSWEGRRSEPAPFSPQRQSPTDVSYFESARHSMVNSLSLNDLQHQLEDKNSNTKYYDLWDGMNYYALAELNQKDAPEC